MCGTTLAAGVPHCWQLLLGPHPLGPSSSTFNTRALSMLWTILQPSYLGCSAIDDTESDSMVVLTAELEEPEMSKVPSLLQ